MKNNVTKKGRIILKLFFVLIIYSQNTNAQFGIKWAKQFGSTGEEVGKLLETDNHGNVYLAGLASDTLGEVHYGNMDIVVVKFDSLGNKIWLKQFGTDKFDHITDLCIDASGNCYITGFTKGMLGQQSFGKEDIYIVKLNNQGDILKKRQYGTSASDYGNKLILNHDGSLLLCGETKGDIGNENKGKTDGFIMKMDNNWNIVFTYQFGTQGIDRCSSMAKDSKGNIYMCGSTDSILGQTGIGKNDAYVMKVSGDGKEIWTKQFGTDSNDYVNHIIINSLDEIYVGGATQGDFADVQKGRNQKGYLGDGIVIRMDTDGNIVWKKQFGIDGWEMIWGIDVSPVNGNFILVSGCQMVDLCQSYCRVFDRDGNQVWSNFFYTVGEGGGTCGKSCCVDNKGNVYHTGNTGGNLFNQLLGKHDIFLVKFQNAMEFEQ